MKENLRYKPVHLTNPDQLALRGDQELSWVLMRSLQAKVPVISPTEDGKSKVTRRYGYENAQPLFCEFFMPMKEQVSTVWGRQVILCEPAVAGMFFVRDTVREIRDCVSRSLGFELQYLKGRKYLEPVILREAEMRNFIHALDSAPEVRFYAPDDPSLQGKVGKKIRISKDGQIFEGHIVSIRGSVRRWLRLSLENCLVAQIEIDLNSLQLNGQVIELLD